MRLIRVANYADFRLNVLKVADRVAVRRPKGIHGTEHLLLTIRLLKELLKQAESFYESEAERLFLPQAVEHTDDRASQTGEKLK